MKIATSLLALMLFPTLSFALTYEENESSQLNIEPAKTLQYVPNPPMTNNQIRDIMIIETLKKNPVCPCPYSPDTLGGQCGTESTYYKPRNFKFFCYRKDISNEDVNFFRLQKATTFYPELALIEEDQKDDTETKKEEEERTSAYFQNNSGIPISADDKKNTAANYFRNNAPNYYSQPTTNVEKQVVLSPNNPIYSP